MGKASLSQLRNLADRIADEEPGKEFKVGRTDLTDDEMKMLMKELNRMMVLTQSTIHRKMLTYHIGYIVFAAEAAKKYFEPNSFGGRFASDTQFGIDSIRPEMLGLNTSRLYSSGIDTQVATPDWGLTYSDAPDATGGTVPGGFTHWVCGSSAATNYKIKEDSLILVTALDNLTEELYGTPPLATAVKPNLMNGEEKPVVTLRPMLVGDMPAMVLPSPWMFLPKTDVRIQKQIRDVGKDCLAMYGLAFGTGSFLKNTAQLDLSS